MSTSFGQECRDPLPCDLSFSCLLQYPQSHPIDCHPPSNSHRSSVSGAIVVADRRRPRLQLSLASAVSAAFAGLLRDGTLLNDRRDGPETSLAGQIAFELWGVEGGRGEASRRENQAVRRGVPTVARFQQAEGPWEHVARAKAEMRSAEAFAEAPGIELEDFWVVFLVLVG